MQARRKKRALQNPPRGPYGRERQSTVRGNLLLSDTQGEVWREVLAQFESSTGQRWRGSRLLRSIVIPFLEHESGQALIGEEERLREHWIDLRKEGKEEILAFLRLRRDAEDSASPLRKALCTILSELEDYVGEK